MTRRHGFTLIELLISMALLTIVAVFLLQTLTVNHRAYVVIDQVSESQQTMRAIATLIERDIRHAGMLVPQNAAVCGVDNANAPDILYVTDADAIDPQDDNLIYTGPAIQGGVSNIAASSSLGLTSLSIEGREAYDTNNDGTNDSDFQAGGGVIFIDVDVPSRGTACGRVDVVDLANDEIDVTRVSAALGSGSGTNLVAIPAHEYRINGTRLLRDGLLLADGVEDLQVAYFFDADDDGDIEGEEYKADGNGGSDAYTAAAQDVSLLREIRVNLVVRTRSQDQNFNRGRFQATENRTTFPTGADGFRRRVFTSTVMPRNVGTRITGL